MLQKSKSILKRMSSPCVFFKKSIVLEIINCMYFNIWTYEMPIVQVNLAVVYLYHILYYITICVHYYQQREHGE